MQQGLLGDQIKSCDVVLTIPGRIDKHIDQKPVYPIKPLCECEEAEWFAEEMNSTMQEEVTKSYISQTFRANLGKVRLHFMADPNMPHNVDCDCPAFAMLVQHRETRFVVLEFYIVDPPQGAVHILESYRLDQMSVVIDEEYLSEEEYLAKFGLRFVPYGSKRSIVFAFGDISEQELVNCLANEETPPDGSVAGELLHRVRNCNRSQYSDYKTYASFATLIETTQKRSESLRERMDYQVSEIFFIERLLFRDASTDKIYNDLKNVEDQSAEVMRAKNDPTVKVMKLATPKELRDKLEEITRHMAKALRFTEYNLFKWPTVRFSAGLIANDFGLESIEAKFQINRSILENWINALDRQKREESDRIQKRFLLIITALSMISTVYSAISSAATDSKYYIAAVGIVAAAYLIYKIIDKQVSDNKARKRSEERQREV